MIVALVQSKTLWEDKEGNIKKMEKVISRYQHVDLYLFPEMSLSGFSPNIDKFKENEKDTVYRTQIIAEKYKTAIGVGWTKACGEMCENHYSIVTPEGEIMDYAKIHPFSPGGEDNHCLGGREIKLCRYKGFNIGVQICYDLRFADTFLMAAEEADFIIVPANWPAQRREHFQCLLQARAIENQIYVAGVNCGGHIGGIYYSGDSGIYNPDGVKCKRLLSDVNPKCNEEKVLIYDIENDVKKFRESFPVLRDRVTLHKY